MTKRKESPPGGYTTVMVDAALGMVVVQVFQENVLQSVTAYSRQQAMDHSENIRRAAMMLPQPSSH